MRFGPNFAGLTCFSCGAPHDAAVLQTVCTRCGLPLRVDYRLGPGALAVEAVHSRASSLWRYAEVHLVPGSIADAGKWLKANGPRDAFDVSTLKEPYRVEGKKTMAYELYEQLGELPDVIVYPTGGGTGLVGMWKAFAEMRELGWTKKVPRLVSVQAEGCAPVVAAFRAGDSATRPWPDPRTSAYGLRVPSPIGGFLCLRALRETSGTAVAVSEAAIAPAAAELSRRSGLDICPEGGAAWAALRQLRQDGFVKPGETVVLFNTGTGLKYR